MEILNTDKYYLKKHQDLDLLSLINRKLLIHKQLERPSRTYCVYSDLHGSYEKLIYWYRNGLGYYKIAVQEIIGEFYNENICELYEKLLLLVNRTRINKIEQCIESARLEYDPTEIFYEKVPQEFIVTLTKLEELNLSRRSVIEDILKLLRGITRGDERRIIKVVPQNFLENFLKLYNEGDKPSYDSLIKGVCEDRDTYQLVASLLVKVVIVNMFDKHINLGDTYDRGENADKLVKLYRTYFNENHGSSKLHYIWGNHDILWMGAALGSPMLAMTALRISMRYSNVAFLTRYGFDLRKLRAFAEKTYKITPTGDYTKKIEVDGWPIEVAIKITKTLLILEEKLTVLTLREAIKIPGMIDYTFELDRHERLLRLLPTGVKEDVKIWGDIQKEFPLFNDVYYPTIDPQNPEKLTSEEQEVVDDLMHQFTTLPKLQDDIMWMFEYGEAYRVVDNTLYFHAAIPADENKELAYLKSLKGKDLFDFVQRDLKDLAKKHTKGELVTVREKALLWYLWCGEKSIFFCKHKMATLERTVFNKEEAALDPLTTWHEKSNPFYANIRDEGFLTKVLTEFHADGMCMGHTPVRTADKSVLSEIHGAYVIDGGASAAYGDRGSVLIHTPECSYVTMHPSLKDLKQAEEENRIPMPVIKKLPGQRTVKIRNLDKGYFLKQELSAINQLLGKKFGDFGKDYYY